MELRRGSDDDGLQLSLDGKQASSSNNNRMGRCFSSSKLYTQSSASCSVGLCRQCAKLIDVPLEDRKQSCDPKKYENGLYLSIILGNSINLSIPNSRDRFEFKRDYERFKLRVTLVLFLVLEIAYVYPSRLIDAFCHFLAVWYYCTLTIRESILRINGSKISGWWVAHHYLACVVGGIALTWPDDVCYRAFRRQFIIFTSCISLVQQLQYQYQNGCLRRLNALGQGHAMDLTLEGFASWMFKGLTFLLPILLVVYLFEIYNAHTLYQLWMSNQCEGAWQVPALALLFLIIGIGNVIVVSMVVIKKFRESKREESVLNKFKSKYPSMFHLG